MTTSDFSSEVWEVKSVAPNSLRPPLQFGIVPQSTVEVIGAQPLQSGTAYRIVLTVMDEESATERNAGTVTFTPF